MKKGRLVKYLILFCLPMTILVCCGKKKPQGDNESRGLPASGGKTLEVVLVVPDEIYKGDIKDTIGKYFMKACKGLPQAEPLFDVVQMNPSGFFNSDMLKKHRNIKKTAKHTTITALIPTMLLFIITCLLFSECISNPKNIFNVNRTGWIRFYFFS